MTPTVAAPAKRSVADMLARGSLTLGDISYDALDVRISTYPASEKSAVTLDWDPRSRTVVSVWVSRRQEAGSPGIFGRQLTLKGDTVGGEAHLNQFEQGEQLQPVIAVDASGGAWVVWRSQVGSGGALMARYFAADGLAGDEFVIASAKRVGPVDPALVALPGGGVAIAWVDASTPNASGAETAFEARQVLLARLDRRTGVSAPARVCEPALVTSRCPDLAASPEGLIVVWQEMDADARSSIRARKFNHDLLTVGDVIDASGPSGNSDVEPAVAVAPSGACLIAWHRYHEASDYDVMIRAFGEDGRALSDGELLNQDRAGLQNGVALASIGERRFLAAWNHHGANSTAIVGRVIDLDGRPLQDESALSAGKGPRALASGAGGQRLAVTDDGMILLAWSGDGGLGDASAAHVTILRPSADPDSPNRIASQSRRASAIFASAIQTTAAEPIHAGDRFDPSQFAGPHEPPIEDLDWIDDVGPEGGSGEPGTPIAFIGSSFAGLTPPDPEIAVGPNHVVLVVNPRILIFTKAGVQTFAQQMNGAGGFWGAQGSVGFVFDPECTYDAASGRYFVMACERNPPPPATSTQGYFLLAVSDDDDPNGTWHKYRFNVTAAPGGPDIDSPNLTADSQAVYLGADFFAGGNHHSVYMLDKASVLAGAPPTITSFTIPTTISQGLGRVVGDAPYAYMVRNQNATTIRLYAIEDPLTTPGLVTFDLTVPAYELASESPPQQGGTMRPITFGSRFWSVEWRDGVLWAVHHQGATRVLARWYEIDLNGWPDSGNDPLLAQSGTIDPGGTIRTFFPAIGSDACGNAIIVYARSSPTEFISMWASWRHRDDPLGTLRGPVLVKATTSYYDRNRWGDYAGVEADPSDPETMWLFHEYATSTTQWTTWVATMPARPRGDIDGDDTVGVSDIPGFVDVLLMVDTDPYHICTADVNGDGNADGLDVHSFVQKLIAP